MTFLPDKITERDEFPDELDKDFGRTTDRVRTSTDALGISATSFARAMSKAFADATTGGKKFDDVLRQLALRLSDMTVAQAFQPLARNLAGGLGDLFGGVFGEDTGTRGRRGRAPDAISLMDKFVRAYGICGRRRDLQRRPTFRWDQADSGLRARPGPKRFCRLRADAMDDSESR